MGVLPSATLLTNELKLHDFKGVKLSVTFGDADLNDGYSYAKMNFRASDIKFDWWIDKPRLNIITSELTLNDKKVWSELNQGPNSGLNADCLDGYHAVDFKDRLGYNHFKHAAMVSNKRYIKIATFTPRRVGNAPDFSTDGKFPYQGIFANSIVAKMKNEDYIDEFVKSTSDYIDYTKPNIGRFDHTDMMTEGIYNSLFRGSITFLKGNSPTTMDIHIGLFEDPTNKNKDGWTCTSKFFYVSLHDEKLPFLNEDLSYEETLIKEDRLRTQENNVVKSNLNNNTEDKEKDPIEKLNIEESISTYSSITPPSENHAHERPLDLSGYKTPPDPSKNNYKAEQFPPYKHEGDSYQRDIDILRLYHVKSDSTTVDGVEIVTHKFELYLAIDEKTEVHIQPYMSSSCIVHQYQNPVTISGLPETNHFIKPKSIYDNRYSHIRHRHYDYESRLDKIDNEVEEIWDTFDYYVVIAQGSDNARKILMTDDNGNVFCSNDNMERHTDYRRNGSRVLVSDTNKCISESSVTTRELAQLKEVRANVQEQLDELRDDIDDVERRVTYIENEIDSIKRKYVKKSGDTMTGNLIMEDSYIVISDEYERRKVVLRGDTGNGSNIEGDENIEHFCLYDKNKNKNRKIFSYRPEDGGGGCIWFYNNGIRLGDGDGNPGPKLNVCYFPPTTSEPFKPPKIGDIWIKNEPHKKADALNKKYPLGVYTCTKSDGILEERPANADENYKRKYIAEWTLLPKYL
ncbi:hypothetical protein KWV16_04635 [Clostridioides difficile]|nr:hypothetical protein [Clostridioides difficile]